MGLKMPTAYSKRLGRDITIGEATKNKIKMSFTVVIRTVEFH